VDTRGDLSHFATQATMMAGTSTSSRSTGWLGRYVDGLDAWDSGFRGVAVSPTVPLHLVGTRAEITAVPAEAGTLWGRDTSWRAERKAMDALRAFATAPSGLGPWADHIAGASKDALDRASTVGPIVDGLPSEPLARDLTAAARTINADLGTRCVAVERQGFDVHTQQAEFHTALLAELDRGLEAFFATLAPAYRSRTTVLVVSEFGRRPAQNSGLGTDHGTAGLALVLGQNVAGGLYGSHPSLTTLDSWGNLIPSVDLRSVYASVLDPWLDADATQLLGGTYEDLHLFAAGPGATPAP
jgi:uncharacterized protein (DUF1501 family)